MLLALALLILRTGHLPPAHSAAPSYAVTDLGTLGGSSQARALSDSSPVRVVGFSVTASGDTHAFLWSANSGIQDLGTMVIDPCSGVFTGTGFGYGINSAGQVVGVSSVAPPAICCHPDPVHYPNDI